MHYSLSFTDNGDAAFYTTGRGPTAGQEYICSLHECSQIPKGIIQSGPLMNDAGQMLYTVMGATMKRRDHSDLGALSMHYAINNAG